MHATPSRPYRGVWKGTPTTATHVSTPIGRRAACAATPTLRERYIRRVGTPRQAVRVERRSGSHRSGALDGRHMGMPLLMGSPIGGYLRPRARHPEMPRRTPTDGFPHGRFSTCWRAKRQVPLTDPRTYIPG